MQKKMSVASLAKSIMGRVKLLREKVARRRLSRTLPQTSLSRSDWERGLADPRWFYEECVRYYHHRLDPRIKAHREYFDRGPGQKRGFGEDAFHVLWYLLTTEFKPETFLEIGVFRGQVISLVSLLGVIQGRPIQVTGISPFSPAGDEVSKYPTNVDYLQDSLINFAKFDLPAPRLLRAYSTDANAVDLIASQAWDLIYIDGSHDYDVVKQDWNVCARSIKAGGIIVLDDSGLTSRYDPPPFATRGHPGPSRVAAEIDPTKFKEILQVGHNRAFQRIA